MKALELDNRTTELVVCVNNDGYEIDLERLGIYEVVPDNSLEPDDIRVVDETGEDYIYPASLFVSAQDIERGRFVA
ncbi:MAG: hypothetical protein H0U91_14140 [Rubrobacter sp.]|jgi:hypothetical protein|nr:hypothetical protein [Rubrobacter sp.]MBA3950402.1 hypothetical protein [Rubrobacter sp.]